MVTRNFSQLALPALFYPRRLNLSLAQASLHARKRAERVQRQRGLSEEYRKQAWKVLAFLRLVSDAMAFNRIETCGEGYERIG